MNEVKSTPLPPHAISTDHPAHPKLHWTREELAWIAARDKQFLTYATQTRADLEAEVQRFREHLTKQNVELDELIPMAQKLEAENQRLREALRIAHDHIEMNALHVSHCKDAATITAAPVAQQYEAGDMASAAAQGFRDGVASVTQQEPVAWQSIESMAAQRYRVVPSHESMFYRHAVVAGDGTQQLYIGREVECENMARKFAAAFLDGAYVAQNYAAPIAQQPQADQSLRQDALQSLAYANGAKAGWNLAVADDEAGFAKIMDQVPEAVRTLKQTRAEQPQTEATSNDLVRDAERLNWLLMQVSGKEFRRIGVEYSGNCQRADIDAAIAQQKGKDNG